jgi:hypothetical protein
MSIWDKLSEKGKLTTILGFILGLVSVIVMCVLMIVDQDYKYLPFGIACGISLLFFILPSSMKIKFKDFEFEIKD